MYEKLLLEKGLISFRDLLLGNSVSQIGGANDVVKIAQLCIAFFVFLFLLVQVVQSTQNN